MPVSCITYALSRLCVKISSKSQLPLLSTYPRLNFFKHLCSHTHTHRVVVSGGCLCLYAWGTCCSVAGSEDDKSLTLFALHCTPEQDSDVFFKLMRYRENWNVWAYPVALSKATRGERQKIEQNCLFSIYYLWRTEKRWLWKRKLSLVFSFFPAAHFPHEHAWFLPCWTLGSGVLEGFLGGEG